MQRQQFQSDIYFEGEFYFVRWNHYPNEENEICEIVNAASGTIPAFNLIERISFDKALTRRAEQIIDNLKPH